MSDQAKLKEQLKKTIRALVISAPIGLTPKEVEVDYEKFEGRPLPFRQLGYNTCQDFLQDIPDTVRVQWNRGHLVVGAVADDSTKHIQSLVSRQKVDVEKCLKKRRASARARPPVVSVAVAKSLNVPVSSSPGRTGPWRPGGFSAGQTRTSSPGIAFNSRPRTRGPPAVQPSVPAYVRNQIKSLLIAHPNGIQNTHFDMFFAEKFGHTIHCNKLGFESLGQMCQALSDFVSIEKLGDGEFRIYEKSNYPGGEVYSENVSSARSARDRSTGHTSSMSRINADSSSSNHANYAEKTATATNNFKREVESNHASHSNRTSMEHSRTSPSDHGSFRNSVQRSDQRQAQDVRSRIPSISADESAGSAADASASTTAGSLLSDLFETKFLEEIQQILAQNPEGLWAACLPEVYKKQFKKALPMMSLGYFSVTELMAAMPEVVAIEREQKQGDWKLYDVRTYKPKTAQSSKPEVISITKDTEAQKKTPTDPSQGFLELKEKVRRLLEKHPEGILLKNLSLYYQRAFCEKFPLEELGFRDVDSLVMMMPDAVSIIYKGHGRLLLVLVEESSSLPRKSIPADAVGWGFSYSHSDPPPIREYIEVYVATVYTPHRICIQLKDKARNDALDELMDNLESIYAYPEGNKYEFPEAMIAVGQVCCALYLSDNNWHRALITGIPKVDFVEVLYIDYGTVATVSRSSLRLLKSSFLRLPIQAYNARLAFIEPAEEKWTSRSRDRLLALTAGKPLIAVVTEIQNDELYLLLSDTTTDEDIHINDTLVEEGLANFAGTLDNLDQQPEPQQTQDYQFSYDEPLDSELAMLMLDDVVAPEIGKTGKKEEQDYDHEEFPELDEQGSRANPSEEIEAATDMHTVSALPGRPTPRPDQSEVNQAPVHSSLADDKTADNETEPPHLERDLNPSSDSQDPKISDMPHLETSLEDGQWIVKRIDLDDGYQVHLINHDSEICLTVAEVAALLCEGEDSEPEEVLCQQVSELGVEMPLLTAIEKEHPRLFRELRRVELLDSFDNSPELLTMIPFSSALLLLGSSGQVGMGVVQQLQEIAEELGVFGDMFGSELSDTALDDLDLSQELEDLQMTLETLQFKRKRLLGSMMQNTDVNYVDELSHIEGKIQEVSERVEMIRAAVQQRQVADKMASSTKTDTLLDKSERHQVDTPPNSIDSRDRETNQSKLPGSPDPRLNVASYSGGSPKSPEKLVQAVEPLPRGDNQSAAAPQLKSTPQPQARQSEPAGYAPNLAQPSSATGQSQGQIPPPANQNTQFTQPANQIVGGQNQYAAFPNPQFPNLQATQLFPLPPVAVQYPVVGGSHHLGSGDFIPINSQNWVGPPQQGPFMTQFAPPQIPLAPLAPLPLGQPPGPFLVNPQGFHPGQGEPGMPGQASGGQGLWW